MDEQKLKNKIAEIDKAIRQMEVNGQKRLRPGTYKLLKERRNQLLQQLSRTTAS